MLQMCLLGLFQENLLSEVSRLMLLRCHIVSHQLICHNTVHLYQHYLSNTQSSNTNDLTIGWQNLNPLSHPNATLAPQARQVRTSGENLNYVTLVPQARQARASGEFLNYLLSR